MSKKPRHIFTPSQIDEMYDDWLHSIEDEVDIAHRYGFRHATTMRKFLEANGKPTVNVKTATCPKTEREKRIKERFIGYSEIVTICIAAKDEGLSYGQYVGKYNL